MKHKLLYPALAVCLVACDVESGSVDILPSGGDVPVDFSASVTSPATRAELTTSNLTSMGVFASYTGQSNWNAATSPNFMYNQRVSRTGSTSPWTYSPVKYWPNTAGDKLTFFAYAPHTTDMTGLSINTGAGVAGYPKLYYDLPVSAASQKDLLVAVPLKDKTKGTASLAFTMKHALTRVLVNVKCVDAITVTKVELNSMSAGYGTLTWNSDGTPTWSFTGSMSSNYSTSTSVPANAANPTQVAEFFLFPVETPSNKLTITYSLNGSSETKEVAIPNTPAWTMGQAVAYTLKIDTGSEITLTVKTWDTNTTSGTVGEDVPTTGYPFMKNGIIYESATKYYYVSPVCYYDVTGDGWGQEDGETSGWYQWDPAIRVCRGVYSFNSYGKGEWRLPTINELDNVVKFGLNGSSLWSCTDAGSGTAWKYRGNIRETAAYTAGHRLLCIRDMGELTYPTARKVNDIPVVYLNSSKSYMVYGSNEVRTHSNAVSYCSSLSYGGYSDWRLPTYEEATWVLNLGVQPTTTYWTSQSGKAIAGSYKAVQSSGGGWQNEEPDKGTLKARTYCVRDY